MILRVCGLGLILFCLVYVYHPERHAKHYPYVPSSEIIGELVKQNNDKYSYAPFCTYSDLLTNSRQVRIGDIDKLQGYESPKSGGEYFPIKCKSLYKTAVIIPYRDRADQLNTFLNYMHSFLQNQKVHYRIYVVEQMDTEPFNRAKMFNIGALVAMNDGFPCLILHDVDLIPLTTGNIYACSRNPRHMSSCLDSFRFTMPYLGLFGGAVSLTSDQYKQINGMSNLYIGWGGEDDDLYSRLEAHHIKICRFSPDLSKYTMLKHKKAVPSEKRYEMLKSGLERQSVDGLNSIKQNYIVENTDLYTHVQVN